MMSRPRKNSHTHLVKLSDRLAERPVVAAEGSGQQLLAEEHGSDDPRDDVLAQQGAQQRVARPVAPDAVYDGNIKPNVNPIDEQAHQADDAPPKPVSVAIEKEVN